MNNCKYEVMQKENKEGKRYNQIHLVFDNGYECNLFINNEQYFILNSSIGFHHQ